MNDEKAKEVLNAYREAVKKTEEALRLVGMPDNLIAVYTINFPIFTRLIPEDAVNIYKNLRDGLIIYLDNLGLSTREIATRLGGSTKTTVFETLKKYKEPEVEVKKGLTEEVMQEEVQNERQSSDGEDIQS